MFGPGEYVPDPTEGIVDVKDLPLQGSSWFPLHICGVKPTLPCTYQLKE